MSKKSQYNLFYEEMEISREDENAYIRVKEKVEYKINKHKISILCIGIVSFLCASQVKVDVGIFQLYSVSFTDVSTVLWAILGVAIQWIIAYRVREGAFNKITDAYLCSKWYSDKKLTEYRTEKKQSKVINIVSFLRYILTPDYKFAKMYKEKIKETYLCHTRSKKCKCYCESTSNYVDTKGLCIHCYDSIKFMNKFLIKFSNWRNLIITMYLTLITLIWFVVLQFETSEKFIGGLGIVVFIILFSLLISRLISRSIEIALAFYIDIVRVNGKIFYLIGDDKEESSRYVHNWRNSYIRKPLRLSLAIHSLFELILTFTMVFLLTFIIFNSENTQKKEGLSPVMSAFCCNECFISDSADEEINKIKDYVPNKKIYEFFLYSISLSFFNISYINYGFWLWNILHVWQVTMSMVLIILSIAFYLGGDDKLLKREEKFFANVLPYLNRDK
ncbi:hypothetical protein JCR32_04170 [Bacillus sp. HNR-4]|uniref:hypothetical protein n=1 Tax=Bacillus sp. HNR-4 TaxID=2796141 RepID=UPI002379BE09|nr:hypothetical protein [Bacillus sp. HNR-4]WDL93024.1 hypothetical protein JCR32_04170 [Bacillus sp. HNR-4]